MKKRCFVSCMAAWIFLYLRSNRRSNPWQQCVHVWPGSVRLLMDAVPRGSRALKAGYCRPGARQQQVGRPGEEPHRYWPHAETLREACTHPPPARDTEADGGCQLFHKTQSCSTFRTGRKSVFRSHFCWHIINYVSTESHNITKKVANLFF